MKTVLRFIAASLLSLQAGVALADRIDPFAVAEKAAEAYRKNDSYPEVRGMFSEALRDARRRGELTPDFAIIYAMYADTTRFDGNPAFALQLADEGLSLLLGAQQPDADMKNSLLVSRAYALADLGRYKEAIETVTITALWMGERFGEAQRKQLEDQARSWAKSATGADAGRALPSAAELALDLAGKADQALAVGNTELALTLASRAMLPGGTGLAEDDVDFQNAHCQSISGTAYAFEGRNALAVAALRRAADLLVASPWDGQSNPKLRDLALTDAGWRRLTWSVFSRLAAAAVATGDRQAAAAAIDIAGDFAATPEQRFALLSQQAGLAFSSGDYQRAEETFRKSEADAALSGDAVNAALSRFYVAIAVLARGDGAPDGPAVRDLLQAATAAADVARDDPQVTEYVLATAVRMIVTKTNGYEAAMPLARRAYDIFRQRQTAMANYDAGQEASRRDGRRFLEIFIAGQYETGAK
ncbi:hypothetical protein [Mesorhizobium sp. M4B.F.Ca.ET.049.02.1.2]|uniref:hypothetical protein n=1 Tax=Mesorhizobium sp. M4B.F.Ca.ET.049.02.1.2 TaxID=2496752 RepID=UPI000FCC7C57|nr:hypothetical protein [Mesorhizobium sp. M4B.F.Ca.ET.049.02.1.2]RUW66793.1 hypothetical protein EOA31_30385 [Mesorhizobium sp. M4B.F.Ca.ET.049.02.1.2]